MKRASQRTQWAVASGLVLGALAGLGGYAVLRSREVPPGQKPMLALSPDNLEPLKSAFNAGKGHTRVIAFLSPT